MPLAILDQRRKDKQPAALGHVHDAVNDLGSRLLCDGFTAVGAVGLTDARKEQAQVVVDFGDRADGGARVATCTLSGRWRWRG